MQTVKMTHFLAQDKSCVGKAAGQDQIVGGHRTRSGPQRVEQVAGPIQRRALTTTTVATKNCAAGVIVKEGLQ